jgi:hypothetical protein
MKRQQRKTKLNRWSAIFLVIVAVFLFSIVGIVYASQGTLYQVNSPESVNGPSSLKSYSGSYNVFSEIGDTVVGTSTSLSFSILHGVTYEAPTGVVDIDIIAVPEKRVPLTGNDDSHVTIEIRNPGGTTPLFSQTVDTDVDGEHGTMNIAGISPGTYDLTAKAYSHLRRKKENVVLGAGLNTVDFTDVGTDKVLCGDVNLVYGDNKVNSLDVTLLVADWFSTDERIDLNQDGQVNSIDMTNMVTNFNLTGDE